MSLMARSSVDEMLRTIEFECRLTRRLIGKDKLQPEVTEAMSRVRRDEFVPVDLKTFAYDSTILPIGNGQAISQSFIVALMTDLLNPGKEDSILEVGTGSGYQAAILSLLGEQGIFRRNHRNVDGTDCKASRRTGIRQRCSTPW